MSVAGRLLMQLIWCHRSKIGWDDALPDIYFPKGNKLFNNLSALSSISFPRCAVNETLAYDLILFCDASPCAFGFVAYACRENASNLLFSQKK